MVSEQHITMAAKLYKMRVTAIRLFREEYKAKTAPYRGFIEKRSAETKKEYLEAAISIAEDVKDVDDSGVATMLIFSAAIDLIENK